MLELDHAYHGIWHPTIFKEVANFLLHLASTEIEHGEKPEFLMWRNQAKFFKEHFRDELKGYAQGQYPFNERLDESQPHAVQRWWHKLVGN